MVIVGRRIRVAFNCGDQPGILRNEIWVDSLNCNRSGELNIRTGALLAINFENPTTWKVEFPSRTRRINEV